MEIIIIANARSNFMKITPNIRSILNGNPFRGKIPCYVDYGIDVFERLKEIGFQETYLKISRWYEAEKL